MRVIDGTSAAKTGSFRKLHYECLCVVTILGKTLESSYDAGFTDKVVTGVVLVKRLFMDFCSDKLSSAVASLFFWWLALSSVDAQSQSSEESTLPNNRVPTISEYAPESSLQVKKTLLTSASLPVIDIHGHFGIRLKGNSESLDKYVELMDRNNIRLSVSLDARLGDEERHLDFLKHHAHRFLVFCHIDFVGDGQVDQPATHACNQPDFARKVCLQLESAKTKGILGLKFFKSFGLRYKNLDGSLIRIDDPRFDPIWKCCAKLKMPVLIHTADPAAFFEPITAKNERYEELLRHPNWSFHGDAFPSRQELLIARNNVIRKHPQTTFIGAHMGGNPEDLTQVGQWLEAFPNLFVEFSSRIAELGRQPFSARKFFLKYQDRILFGTDGPWPEERLSYYWRFLETQDEYFRYSEKRPQPQGLWRIYGLNLPEPVLKKIYSNNALNLLPDAKIRFSK